MIHGVNIDKDPSIDKLQNDVLSKIADIIKPEPGQEQPLQNDIKIISPEEALKELLDLDSI